MTVFQGIFWILGTVAAIVLACLGALFLERSFPGENYDERQKAARGRAYRFGFGVGLVYFLIVMMVLMFQTDGEGKTIEPYLLIFFGLMIQILTMNLYCLLTRADLPFAQKRWTAILCYLFLALAQLSNFLNAYARCPEMPLTGQGSATWVYLTMTVVALLLALFGIVARFWKERE